MGKGRWRAAGYVAVASLAVSGILGLAMSLDRGRSVTVEAIPGPIACATEPGASGGTRVLGCQLVVGEYVVVSNAAVLRRAVHAVLSCPCQPVDAAVRALMALARTAQATPEPVRVVGKALVDDAGRALRRGGLKVMLGYEVERSDGSLVIIRSGFGLDTPGPA